MKAFKNIVVVVLLALLGLPLLQQLFKPVEVVPLSGAFTLPDAVPLNTTNWFNGEFQEKYSPFYEYEIGFRPWFVRLRNQLYYWAYHQSTNYVVVGKEDQLFAWNYWSPYYGLDFIGEDSVSATVGRIARLKSKLDSMGVPLLVVIGANKVRYSANYLPDDLSPEERLPNNYGAYLPKLRQAGISVVDFNQVFAGMKDEVGKAMFPNTGTHWSAYGMALCLDSILGVADRHTDTSIQRIGLKGFVKVDSIIDSDIDLSNDLNLIFPVERQPNLFPKTKKTGQGRKARLFVIGDSFYWNLYQLDAFYETVDSASHFWYYNNTDIAVTGERHPVEEYDPVELARNADVVVLLATEANLHLFPFGFPKEFLQKATRK